jgi:hypothetical protein
VEFIQLSDALSEMEKLDDKGFPVRFSIVCWTYSESRGTGGEEVSYKNVCLNDVRADVPNPVKEEFRREKPISVAKSSPRNPHHFANKTRNLRLENNQIRKIHIRFIKSFNGKQIIY